MAGFHVPKKNEKIRQKRLTTFPSKGYSISGSNGVGSCRQVSACPLGARQLRCTMKSNAFRWWMLGPVLLFFSAGIAMAGASVPASYSFEEYTNGYNWLAEADWYSGHENDQVSVSNLVYTNNFDVFGGAPLPTNDYAHTNVLYYETESISSGISNVYDNPGSMDQYIDVMLKMGAVEEPETSTLIQRASTNINKTAVYVNTNGYLVVWRRVLDGVAFVTNDWVELYNTPIGSNDWVRLTITLNHTAQISRRFFKISLNSGKCFTNEHAYTDDVITQGYIDNAFKGGHWFSCPANGTKYIGQIGFDGRGMVDDLCVRQGEIRPPYVDITNDDPVVTADATISLGGTNNQHVLGDMIVTNDTTLEGATFPATNVWLTPSIGIIDGDNTIRVIGTNLDGTVASDGITVSKVGGPSVVITTTNSTVLFETTNYVVEGTANADVVGDMIWSNNLTGITGAFARQDSWSTPDIGLNVGPNIITVYGTNVVGTEASDSVTITRKAMDDDADGIVDWWEEKFFPGTGCEPNEDSDDDGASNFEEYCAGTDPTDPASIFTIVEKGRINGSNYVKYIGGTNAFILVPYRVDATTNIADPVGWWGTGVQSRAEGTSTWYTPIPADAAYYYRLAAPTN